MKVSRKDAKTQRKGKSLADCADNAELNTSFSQITQKKEYISRKGAKALRKGKILADNAEKRNIFLAKKIM